LQLASHASGERFFKPSSMPLLMLTPSFAKVASCQ
jgi:hypothetical protein